MFKNNQKLFTNQKPKNKAPTVRALLALEQRFLLDAAAAATAVESYSDNVAAAQAEYAVKEIFGTHTVDSEVALADGMSFLDAPILQDAGTAPTEVVFIDGSVPNAAELLEGINPNADVYFLDIGSDGVEQIADILAGYESLDAVHILAHGQQGEIELGDTSLNAASMSGVHAEALGRIGAALSESGDIFIYGCNFADGAEGEAAARQLAELTGADIAASTDNTGSAEFNGNWTLEFTAGAVNSDLVIAATEFSSILAPINIDVAGIGATLGVDALGRTTATYVGGGDLGGVSVDVILTVNSGTTPFFGVIGNDIAFQTNAAGVLEIGWSFVRTSDGAATLGAVEITISDIDGTSTTTGVPGAFIERVTGIQDFGFLSYTVNGPTDLQIVTTDGRVDAAGSVQDTTTNGLTADRDTAAIRFNFADQSEFQIIYEVTSAGRVFTHDGNGDFVFSNAVTVNLPQLDLDGDDDTATGADYAGTFSPGNGGVQIVDVGDVSITNAVFPLTQATVDLTNAMSGDEILVNGSTAASGMIGTLSYMIVDNGGSISVVITGNGTAAEYAAALEAITYNNTQSAPDATPRNFDITITDSNNVSGNPAQATIGVLSPPTIDVTANDFTENSASTGDVVATYTISDPDDVASDLTVSYDGTIPDDGMGNPLYVLDVMNNRVTLTAAGAAFVNAGNDLPPVNLKVTDPDNLMGTDSDDPAVTLVNDAPVIDVTANDFTEENASTGDAAATFTLADEDNAAGDLTVTFTSGASPTDGMGNPLYVIDQTNGRVNLTAAGAAFVNAGNDLPVIDLTVEDPGMETGTDSDDPAVTLVNDPVVVSGTPIPNQTDMDDDTGISVQTAGAFSDEEGDTLTYSVVGLPAGLTINAMTGEITGTIDNSASQGGPLGDGVYNFTVTATDPSNNSVDVSAQWTVTNPPPVAGTIPDEMVTDGASVSIDTTGAFSDPDNDDLTYSATGLPAWLMIDSMTGEISGTAPIDASTGGPFSVTVTVDDGEGGSASETFLITPQNPAPVVTPTLDQNAMDGEMVSLDISAAFNDPDGDDVTYAVTGLPPGLMLDPVTGIISGTLTNNASQMSPYTVEVTATDADGATAVDTFVWNVENPAPTVVNQIPNQSANDSDPFTLDIAPFFNDADADSATFSAIGLPPGLSIDPMTGEISGTLPADASMGQPYIVSITIDDGEGGMATDTFAFTINNLNPGLVEQIGNQVNIDGEMITPLDISDNFEDPDGDPLTFSATGLPLGLSIDPMTGVITGTIDPSASQGGPYLVAITASDGTNDIVDGFTWNVENPVPVVTTAVPDQLDTDGDGVSFPVAGFFDDPDADGLTFSAAGLPPGLSIDPMTGEISGTLPNDASANGPYSVTLTATDGDGDSVVTAFTWNVDNIPPLPIVEPDDLSNNDSDVVSVPTAGFFEDSDNDPIVYTATGLPPGLSIDPLTGEITGTIDSGASVNGPYTPVITATDNAGDSASVTFAWTVDNPAPIAADDMVQTQEDTPITIDPLANDNSPDGDILTIAQINGISVAPGDIIALPDGGSVAVNLNGTLTYMPGLDANGIESFTYTVSDGEGGQSTATVVIDVIPVEDAPRLTDIVLEDQVNNETDEISLDVSDAFSDPDGGDLTFSATGLPPGLTIDPITGVISGEPVSGSAIDGPFSVVITATDENGNQVTALFTWTLNATGADIQTLLNLSANVSPNINADFMDVPGSQQPFEGIAANGVVKEAANGLRSLSGLSTLGAEGAVRSAVNGANHLDGIGGDRSQGDTFKQLLNRIDDRFGTNYSADGFTGAEGFSSGIDVVGTRNVITNRGAGQFMIDTFVRDRVLFVQAFDTIAGRGFKEFRATLGDGRALPDWISTSSDGLLLVERPSDVETVTLKITGLRENGGSMTRYVAIDTLTGEIKISNGGVAYGQSFSASLENVIQSINKHEQSVDTIIQKSG